RREELRALAVSFEIDLRDVSLHEAERRRIGSARKERVELRVRAQEIVHRAPVLLVREKLHCRRARLDRRALTWEGSRSAARRRAGAAAAAAARSRSGSARARHRAARA